MKLCECGCGHPTPIATMTSSARGHVKGQPIRFINGHQNRNRVRVPIVERFWAKVRKSGPEECWEWIGARVAGGYGLFSRTRAEGPIYAHRWAYEHFVGAIPTGEGYHGMCVLHRCDNPRCVNPAHLFLGTHRDNMDDRNAKGRCRGRYST